VYLKRLELTGFKTFADRTCLEFGPGIAAIVGPNGSGKSNLSDAVVWSLGEQGLKSVRTAHSYDVIFAGSESRRRAGVGEVSLTLDNSDGALPLEFSEVTITRRVFRTGEGEYFINRVPCRLRDIHELFLDTGIGRNAYSVISQTEVDRILSVRAEDRREMFEQAAGVQRYRKRRDEATRKLDRVCGNLVRVNDIIHELEGQREPLAQQSEAAREYKRLSKELFDLRLSLLVHEHRALSANLSRAREREVETEREIEAARTRSHRLAAEEVELRGKLQEVEERLEEMRGLAARRGSEADRAEGRLALAEQRIADLEGQAGVAREELAKVEAQLGAAEEELAAAEEERPALEARVRELGAEIEARERRLREEAGALETAGSSAEEGRAEHLEVLRELADARNRLVQCESLVEAARARMARLGEQRGALRERRAEAERRAAEAARLAEEKRAERGRLQAEVYSLQSEERAAEAAGDELAGEELRLRERLSAVNSRLHALEEMEQAREGLSSGVRAVLGAVESGRLDGEYRTVADMLRAPAELEYAVAAALGPAAGDLVVPSQAEAAVAIAFLKETNGGRATFLPQSNVKISPRAAGLPELAKRPGCLGSAADLVTCEEGAEGILEHLLGRVLVVEDLGTARELAGSAEGWQSIVTRDGDLVRPWGAMTGGSKPGRSQLIGRGREISELGEERQQLESALARVGAKAAETRERAEAARSGAEARRGELDEVLSGLAEAERSAEVLGESVRLETQREEGLASEERVLAEEASQLEGEQAAAGARVKELDERRSSAEAATREHENALREGRDARETLRAAAADLRVELTAVEGDLRALAARAEKVGQSREVLQRSRADKQGLLKGLEGARQEAAASLEELGLERERLRGEHGSAEKELAGLRESRQGVLEEIAGNLEAAGRLREDTEELQARLHRCQVRIAQLDSEIGFCERTLGEEYRISLEEAEGRAGPIESRTAAQQQVKGLQAEIEALGEVNLGAIEEYERVRQRLEFLGGQRADLEGAREDLQEAIVQIDGEATERFLESFEALRREFKRFFVRLFGGGEAELILTDRENVLECGVDVVVTVPGKKTRNLLQLSGGERALTAAAILFALLKVKPSPFVILDEIDAPLDDANVDRYRELLREFAQESQFVVITHNKGTMEAADVLYGVTMEEPGVSKLIGMRLRDEGEQPERPREPEATPVLEPAAEPAANRAA
jgi:chromosome segregation protein